HHLRGSVDVSHNIANQVAQWLLYLADRLEPSPSDLFAILVHPGDGDRNNPALFRLRQFVVIERNCHYAIHTLRTYFEFGIEVSELGDFNPIRAEASERLWRKYTTNFGDCNVQKCVAWSCRR